MPIERAAKIKEALLVARIALDLDPENSPPQWTRKQAAEKIDAVLKDWCDDCGGITRGICCLPSVPPTKPEFVPPSGPIT